MPPKCWHESCAPPHPACISISNLGFHSKPHSQMALWGYFLVFLAEEQWFWQQHGRWASGLRRGRPTEDSSPEEHQGSVDGWEAVHGVWDAHQESEVKPHRPNCRQMRSEWNEWCEVKMLLLSVAPLASRGREKDLSPMLKQTRLWMVLCGIEFVTCK